MISRNMNHEATHQKTHPPSVTFCHEASRDYHRGLIPLIAPLILIRHHVRLNDVACLAGQTYLEPHPKELMLRNHV